MSDQPISQSPKVDVTFYFGKIQKSILGWDMINQLEHPTSLSYKKKERKKQVCGLYNAMTAVWHQVLNHCSPFLVVLFLLWNDIMEDKERKAKKCVIVCHSV